MAKKTSKRPTKKATKRTAWKDASKVKPDKWRNVLVKLTFGPPKTGYFCATEGVWFVSYVPTTLVTHWCELPE